MNLRILSLLRSAVPASVLVLASAFAHAHQSWALENLEREDLGDLTWAGIGFSIEF